MTGQAAAVDMALSAHSLADMAPPVFSDEAVLASLGSPGAASVGSGGEAVVYALPENRVARIMRPGARLVDAENRATLLREIAASAATLSFRTPVVQAVNTIGDRVVTLEERLPGEPVSDLLGRLTGNVRRRMLVDYLDTAARIRQAKVFRPYFGPLIGDRALRVGSWSDFARAKLAQNSRHCPTEFRAAVRNAMDAGLREPTTPSLVHLDYFPPNVLAEEDGITAVLDFGPSAVIGDPRMESWSAVAYLDAEISPNATDADRMLAMEWLAEQGLVDDYAQARRWLAASWTHATDDLSLDAWCRRVLLAVS